MRDVIFLANIIEYNNRQTNQADKITLPATIVESPVYYDALLYNVAKAKGIVVIGAEGKDLLHHKDSPCYNKAREEYMAKTVERVAKSGNNVILLVGSEHIDRLSVRLGVGDKKTSARTDEETLSAGSVSKAGTAIRGDEGRTQSWQEYILVRKLGELGLQSQQQHCF